MNLKRSLDRISQLMSLFLTQVKADTAMGKTDINKVAETVLIPLFTEVYSYTALKNLNYDASNYPGIDLGDETARVAFQITSTPDSEKIKKTLRKFTTYKLYKKYDRLIIYILTEKQKSYSGSGYEEIIQGKFAFDKDNDIWDYRDILREVANFQIDKARKVESILEANFGEGRTLTEWEVVDNVERIVNEYSQLFVGREEESQKLDKFFSENSSGLMLVTAGAGFGKTALLANWVNAWRDKDCFIAYHFFTQRYGSVKSAFRNLLRQLYIHYKPTYEQIPNDEEELKIRLYNLLREYAAREAEPLIIVIDGLDEAENTFSPPFPNPLPENVYVIASARAEEGDEHKYLEYWTDNSQKLNLSRLSGGAIAQWLRNTDELAAFAEDTYFIAQLDEITQGFPLYLRYLTEELIQAQQKGEDVQVVLTRSPKGFGAYVQEQFKRLAQVEEIRRHREVQELFALLSVALGALSEDDIQELTDLNEWDLAALPWQVTRWFSIQTGFYSFAHPLLAQEFQGVLKRQASLAKDKLIKYCSRWQEHQSRYALRHYAEHLRGVKQWEELYNLLTDFEYIDTKICTLGSQPLIEDYDLTFNPDLITFEQGLQHKAECLKLIQGALRLSAHVLEQDKTQLAGRLLGHLMHFDAPEIQRLLSQAKQWKATPWLRPLTPSLTSPNEPLIRTFTGHSGSIWSVAVTPDGEQVISGSQDGTLKIWNLNTGILEHTIPAHNGSVNALSITPDGSHVISGSHDKTLKVWNLKTGELVRPLTGHSSSINAIGVTPDGLKVISGSSDCSLKVWDLKTGKVPHTLVGHRASIQAVTTVFTKNKKWVVSGSYNDTLRVWNLETGKEEFTLGECDMIWSLAATLDGERVISASQDGTLTVWKVEAWEKEDILRGHSEPVRTVAVTSDGKHIISGSSDGIIKIWKVGTWKNEATFTAHTAWVLAVAVTPDGNQIISASGNNPSSNEYLLKVWNLEKCIKQFSCNNECDPNKAHSSSVEVIAFTPDGKEVISASKDGILKTWEVGTWKNKDTFKGQSKSAEAIGDYDRQKYFILEADKVNCFLHSTRNTLELLMATTADGKLQVWASGDETLQVWDVSAGQLIAKFTGESEIKCCAIASDKLTIVAGEASGRLHFLRLEGTASS